MRDTADEAEAGASAAPGGVPPPLHPDVVRLGLVSLLTDLSSEMIFSVFAVVFTTVAGASTAWLGLVEGLADLAASSLTFVAGRASDRHGRRKAFALAGYGFSTLAKALLLAPATVAGLALFRVTERLGKGLRGPPRDAWLAALTPPSARGYAFGAHKALDKAGAVAGPLLAYALLNALGPGPTGWQVLFWIAFVPAVASVALLARVPDRRAAPLPRSGLGDSWRTLGPGFKRFLVPAGVFALGYYSLGFLLLRAHAVGFDLGETVLLYALFNAVCVLASPVAGRLGDRCGRGRVVVLGYALYGAVNVGLVLADSRAGVGAIFVLYGLFFAIDESQCKAFVADLEPRQRATAHGLYTLVTGIAYLPASLLAGALWLLAPPVAFGAAALLSALAIAAFAVLRPSA